MRPISKKRLKKPPQFSILAEVHTFSGGAAVAQLAVNQLVAGSNPAPRATKKSDEA